MYTVLQASILKADHKILKSYKTVMLYNKSLAKC